MVTCRKQINKIRKLLSPSNFILQQYIKQYTCRPTLKFMKSPKNAPIRYRLLTYTYINDVTRCSMMNRCHFGVTKTVVTLWLDTTSSVIIRVKMRRYRSRKINGISLRSYYIFFVCLSLVRYNPKMPFFLLNKGSISEN